MVSAVNEPWDVAAAAELPLVSKRTLAVGLGPLVVARDVEQPSIPGFCLRLPRHGPPFPCGGLGSFVAFDLPVTGHGDRAALAVRCGASGTAIEIAEQIPRPRKGSNSSEAASQEPPACMQRFIEAVVALMLELRLLGECQTGRVPEEHLPGSLQGIIEPRPDEFDAGPLPWARIPWSKVATCLQKYAAEPSRDVIVSIAEDTALRDRLQRLVRSPRRMLRRERQLTALARVQETDHACLEWLVRRPGRTATEKAGATQEILAVVRRENYDTLENRVLRDFLLRCVKAAELYLAINARFYKQEKSDKPGRCVRVERYAAECRRLLRESVLEQVSSIYSVPQPNYVLLHDVAYREVWTWYLRLVHRERQADEAWKWQRRLWADLMRLCIGAAFHAPTDDGLKPKSVFEHDLWVHDEQQDGCWFAAIDWPGPVVLQPGTAGKVVAECIHPHHPNVQGYGVAAEWCGALGADMLVQFSPLNAGAGGRNVFLFIWAIHSAAEDPADPRVQEQPRKAVAALEQAWQQQTDRSALFRGLILRSDFRCCTVSGLRSVTARHTRVDGLLISAAPSEWANGFIPNLRQLLGKCALDCFD